MPSDLIHLIESSGSDNPVNEHEIVASCPARTSDPVECDPEMSNFSKIYESMLVIHIIFMIGKCIHSVPNTPLYDANRK